MTQGAGLSALDRGEVLRYLGVHGGSLPLQLLQALDRCTAEMLAAAEPRWLYRRFPLRRTEAGICLEGTSLCLTGRDIANHLSGCGGAFLLCATIGVAADSLIRRRMLTAPEEGVMLDACATQAIEQTADLAEAEIAALCRKEGHGITWRYSPGYGDLPLTLQRDFLAACDAQRRIGLAVT